MSLVVYFIVFKTIEQTTLQARVQLFSMYDLLCILFVLSVKFSCSQCSAVFSENIHQLQYKDEIVNNSIRLNTQRENILRFYESKNEIYNNVSKQYRCKRFDQTSFRGNPKTREERWHANFKMNDTNMLLNQTQSLVTLLNKIVDKYLNACIPIILYDKSVEESGGIALQSFFQVH